MALIVALFLLSGVVQALFFPFASAVLATRGFSPEAIGLLGAIVSIAFLGSAWAWGHLADVVLGRPRALRAVIVLSAAMLAAFALPLPLFVLGAVYVAYAATYATMTPLSDALAVNALRDPARQYGPLRGALSGVFAASIVAFGVLYAAVGYGPAIPIFIAVSLPLALLAGRLPDADLAKLRHGARGGAMREALRVQPRLPGVLLAIALGSIGVFACLTFLPLRIIQLGGGPAEIAIAASCTAVVELAVMPLVSRFLARTGLRAVYTAACVVLVIVFAWFALAPSPIHVVAASLLYGVGWSGLWVSSVMTMRALLPAAFQGSGQSLLSATTSGGAALIANAGGGLLWTGFGAPVVFGVVAVIAAGGAVAGWRSFPRDARPVSEPAPPSPLDGPAAA
jgi:MFS family permease